jgi:uncharacterized protein YbjT (DUF2867 family)
MQSINKVLVIGATGGSGRSTVQALVEQGYQVTALSRNASNEFASPVATIDGSALDRAALELAIKGQDAVVITLGISENPLKVRLIGPTKTPHNIRSEGTLNTINAMQKLNVNRLIVQTSYGSGPSKGLLRTLDKLFFNLLLKPQIEDTNMQDKYVRESALNWTIVQPVHLTDDTAAKEQIYASPDLFVANWSISRKLVGKFNALALKDTSTYNQTVALSAA